MTQTEKLLAYLRANPGASAMELVTVLRIPKYTSRISDLRKSGVDVVVERDAQGVNRYRVVEKPQQMAVGW